MTISAKVIAHSVSSLGGPPLITLKITFHRYVLAEFNTHRMFSRNFRSSRAVPVRKLLAEVRTSPAMPITWQANQPGMQGGAELTGEALAKCRTLWMDAARSAADSAEAMMTNGLHKSWANRVLEPYLYVHGVVSSTQWSNFFALRCHPAAQPEMRALADAIFVAIAESDPVVLKPGQWHLPFVGYPGEGYDFAPQTTGTLIKCSVARCARVSYETQDGKPSSWEEDLALYDRLVTREPPEDGSKPEPIHASPAEHQATPHNMFSSTWNDKGANFGQEWTQFRKTLPNECL